MLKYQISAQCSATAHFALVPVALIAVQTCCLAFMVVGESALVLRLCDSAARVRCLLHRLQRSLRSAGRRQNLFHGKAVQLMSLALFCSNQRASFLAFCVRSAAPASGC